MADEVKEKDMKKEKPSIEYGYKILRNSDGSVDVEALEFEGKEKIPQEAIYEDILGLAKMIEDNKQAKLVERACQMAGYYGARKALEDYFAAKDAQEAQPSVEVDKK